ncbi:unnamed protein product [Ilex paraguariensis]|uniref:Uncharacterized protein n=1 Tax=Ilex paraguariensis TaxID=185542 RepID=A0ABC8TMU6_9AQUA
MADPNHLPPPSTHSRPNFSSSSPFSLSSSLSSHSFYNGVVVASMIPFLGGLRRSPTSFRAWTVLLWQPLATLLLSPLIAFLDTALRLLFLTTGIGSSILKRILSLRFVSEIGTSFFALI